MMDNNRWQRMDNEKMKEVLRTLDGVSNREWNKICRFMERQFNKKIEQSNFDLDEDTLNSFEKFW